MNAPNPFIFYNLLREAILPLKVTTLTEMNRTSMVQRKCVASIQMKLLYSFNWANVDLISLLLSPLHFLFDKEAWRCLNGNKCNMAETNLANIAYEAGSSVMKMQWGRKNEDGSGSSGALIILVLEIFHTMLWRWDWGVCDRLIYLTVFRWTLVFRNQLAVSISQFTAFVVYLKQTFTESHDILWYCFWSLTPKNVQLCSLKSFSARNKPSSS